MKTTYRNYPYILIIAVSAAMLACPGRVRAATPPPTVQEQTVAAVDASVAASSNAMWTATIRRLSKATLRDAPAAVATAVQGPSTNGQRSVRTVLSSQAAAMARTEAPARQSARSAQTMDSMSTCVRAGSGLIGWWQAENNANDSAGAHHGQLVNGAACAAGMVEYGFLFDGVDESVEIPSPSGLATPSFTIETWVYPAAQAEPQVWIFGQAYGRQLVLWPVEEGLAVGLFVTDPDGNFFGVESTAVIPVEDWSHLAATYDGTYLKLYINGVFNAQREPGLSEIGVTPCPFSIGAINNSCASGQYFEGLIDEVSLYDRALFQGEINAIWQAGAAGKCKSPPVCVTCPDTAVSWWAAEGDGADAFRRNTGTLQNNVGFAAGMTGQAFSLDGVSKAVKFPPPNSLATPSFSIEAWVNPTDQAAWQAFIFGQSYGRQLIVRAGNRGLSVAFVISTDPWNFYEVDSSAEIPIGEWTHLVGSWDSTSSALSLYINGALDQQATLSVVPWDSGCAFHLGGINDPTGDCAYVDQFFYGLIDETTLYSAALSPEQVQILYNAGGAGKCNIPGSWLAQYFGPAYQTDPNAALNADPDRDGLTNLEEFQHGTDPTNSDTDGDLLSDGHEVHLYGSDPADPNTYSGSEEDAVYLLSGKDGGPNPVRIDDISYGSLITITTSGTPAGAPPGTPCDLYVEYLGISGPPEWRLYACGSPGQTVFNVPYPSFFAQWVVASAFDEDGDGVTDGAEALFCHSKVNNPRSDGVMPDAWKVQWGLMPTSTVDPDGPNWNPDQDTFNGQPFTNQQEMQSATDPWKPESVAPRPVVTVSVDTATATRPGNGHAAVPAAFRITRSDASTGGFTVNYCVGGTGSYGTDYTLLPAPSPEEYEFTVVFAAGESSKLVQVIPAAGSGSETVTVGLVPPWPSYITGAPSAWPYVVDPKHDRASATIFDAASAISTTLAVAIHDSSRNRSEGISSPDWRYAVMPESVKEAFRSDGTPFVTLDDDDLTTAKLLDGASPRYPIVISLAAERISDAEASALRNYVNAGGFLLVGSSAFTKDQNGTARDDFALNDPPGTGTQMGVHYNKNTATWVANSHFTKQAEHRLVSHIPAGTLTWRMPTSWDEISWGACPGHSFEGPHPIWPTSLDPSGSVAATANGDLPYLVVRSYGAGCFIYDAALQPLIAHGGFGPGMYAYVIFKNAIEWAFESNQRPVARLSPWPYSYDAAFMIRHDFENVTALIEGIRTSAEYEQANQVKGDYYFCTGAILGNQTAIDGLAAAVEAGATIGPHNGGRENPRSATFDPLSGCEVDPDLYEYYHWGPDEALGITTLPAGYASGRAYALDSLSLSFDQIDTWLKTSQNPRLWVSPYFNATREPSFAIQEQLGVKITGDQKLTPFPHWTLSTQTDGKRYSFLSEPTSEWFLGGQVSQSLEDWNGGRHTQSTVRDAVDYYYGLGALINLYSHTLSDGSLGAAGMLAPEYIQYCKDTQAHPRMWAANAKEVYQWWLQRSGVEVRATLQTSGGQTVVNYDLVGARDPESAVELYVPGTGSAWPVSVLVNGTPAPSGTYRTDGKVIKVKAGGSAAQVQVQYVLGPTAVDDGFKTEVNQPLTGNVLANDLPASGLTAHKMSGEPNLVLNEQTGSFTYTWATPGRYTFTYKARQGQAESGVATVSILVLPAGALFSDDFTRASDPDPLPDAPWSVAEMNGLPCGTWAATGGVLQGRANALGNWVERYAIAFNSASWSGNYSVQARIKFPAAAAGGGLGGRVNTATGARYAAWIYPEQESADSPRLALIKFSDWVTWDYLHLDADPNADAVVNLPAGVGTGWHTLKLTFQGNQIQVYYDGAALFGSPITDSDYSSGGVSAETWTDKTALGPMSVDDVMVTPAP